MAVNLTTENKLGSHQLDVGCLKDIIDALRESYFPNHRWFPLGLQLGLLQPTLTEIEANHRDDVERCLHECLTKWLSRTDKVDENGGPTINSLVDALKKIGEVATAIKITELLTLKNFLKKLAPSSLPTEVTHTLLTEGVITKETFYEVERSGSLLANGPLRTLSSTVSKDPNQLRVFGSVLLQSEDTVHVGQDILKEYNKVFPKVTLELSFQKKFDEMKVTFGKLIHIVAPLIAKGIPSLQELKTFLRRCFRELKPQLSIAESFDDVMELVEDKCTIINIVCLEAIVDMYNIIEAKKHIKEYQTAVDTFCNEVKLNVCENQSFLTNLSTLLKCETVEFVLEWEPDDYTLTQIRDLLTEAFKDITKRVQIRVIKRGNSVIVTCYAPRHIMDVLLIEAEKNLDLLKKLGLIKLTIGYCTLWDRRTRDKEIKGLEEETRKALAEVNELKSSLEAYTSMDEKQSIDTLSEKIKLLDRMSKTKTLELNSVRQSLQKKEREIEELKSKLKEKEEISIMERKVIQSIKQSSEDKEKEIETLQEKITLLTLQLSERDETISRAGSEVKMQSKISKAKTIVINQLKSAFKRKEVHSSVDNDDLLLSSVKHSSGSPTQDKHIVKIEEDRNNESSENLLFLPHQEVRSSSDTSLTAYSDVQTEDHTLSTTGYSYMSRHSNQPSSGYSSGSDPSHRSALSNPHLTEDVPRYGYPDHYYPPSRHHRHRPSIPSTLTIPDEIPEISVQTPTPVMENFPISPTGIEPFGSIPNTPPEEQTLMKARPKDLPIRRREKHPTPVLVHNVGVKFERQRSHSMSHLQDEEMAFSGTETDDDVRIHRRERQSQKYVADDEYSTTDDDIFPRLPLRTISKQVSLSEPDLTPTPDATVFIDHTGVHFSPFPNKWSMPSKDSGFRDDSKTFQKSPSSHHFDGRKKSTPSSINIMLPSEASSATLL